MIAEMPKRIVVTDAACSIPLDVARRAGIALLPLHITWPDETQDTDFTVLPEQLYARMQTSGIPTTSGVTPADFLEFYQGLYEQGAREIVSVHLTRLKSFTVDSAEQAAGEVKVEFPDMKIKVIDTQHLSLGQWFLVAEAKEMLQQGRSLDEIEKHIQDCIPDVSLYVGLATRKNLIAGGRLKGASKLLAEALNILPLIQIKQGDLHLVGRVRGGKGGPERVRRSMVEHFREEVDEKGFPARLGVVYTRDHEVGDELAESLADIRREEGVKFYGPMEAGAVLGVHAGPGAGAIAAFWRRS